MSYWAYIMGTLKVRPMGRTQLEKEYILKTVLEHLPLVTGSEEDMYIHINQCGGYDSHDTHNEFGEDCYYQKRRYSNYHKWGHPGWLETQDGYILTIEGSFRDRTYDDTFREFNTWLCRLAKRVRVVKILTSISTRDKSTVFNYGYESPYYEMFEEPSWVNDTGEPNWCEYLMWDRGADTMYPMSLAYKYYRNEANDKEYERRRKWNEEN